MRDSLREMMGGKMTGRNYKSGSGARCEPRSFPTWKSDGSLTATLASGPGYQLGTTATAAVTIEDSTGDPDVNASGSVDANDALILYYAYSLRNDLGTGR